MSVRIRAGAHRAGFLVALSALGLVALLAAAPALAGTYTVRQCDAAGAALNPAAPDAVGATSANAYATRDRCEGTDEALRVDDLERTSEGRYGLWAYTAPAGAEFLAVSVGARLVRDEGHVPALLMARTPTEGAEVITEGDSGGWRSLAWSAPPGDGRSEFDSRLRCEPGSGNECRESSQAAAWVRNLRLTLNDVSSPTLLLDGALVAGGWRSGTQSLAVSAEDDGGGLHRIEVEVNGATAADRVFDCATIPGADSVSRMRPCEPDQLASFDLDTDQSPFREGTNTVEVCAEDFGTDSVNRTCASRTVLVDNEGPGAPQNLRLLGGDDWRPVNDFDLVWENPPQPDGTAQVDGAWYRLEREDGATVEGPTLLREARIDDISSLDVPEAGEYVVRVWLNDEAGNAGEADAAVARLRFDDIPPGPVAADDPSGWLSRRELLGSFEQTWSPAAATPVSGVRGYAVAVDRFPSTNPCESVGDPDPASCAGAELTHPGEDSRSQSASNLPEGSSWVHVAAVSGSGLRSTSVSHVELRADRTDPATELIGALPGWSNQPATLIAQATDDLSGMQPEAGDDGDPGTFLRVDGGPILGDPDNEVVHALSEEGDHEVRYWARDLAGNENDGDPGLGDLPSNNQPGEARVRLDMTDPTLAFQDEENPADPELIRAPVADSLAGVSDGQISYRRQGDTAWQAVPTSVTGGALEARLPSEQLPDGLYELRADATDHAGNTAETTRRQSGGEMVLELPLKVQTELSAKLESGGTRDTIGYGRESRVEGRLVDAAGEPLPGESLGVTERFDLGSTETERTREAITDGDGRYALVLPSGPSREIEVGWGGSSSHAGADSGQLDLGVRGDAILKTSKHRPRVGERFKFSGRVRRRGAEIPTDGKLVELQVKRPEGWDTVRQAFRTNGEGRWRFDFRFGDYYVRPTTFRFRLKVTRENGWPYRLATTDARRITVVPRG